MIRTITFGTVAKLFASDPRGGRGYPLGGSFPEPGGRPKILFLDPLCAGCGQLSASGLAGENALTAVRNRPQKAANGSAAEAPNRGRPFSVGSEKFHSVVNIPNRSQTWNEVPPETMKMQPRIPPLRPPPRTPVGMTLLWRVEVGGQHEFSRQVPFGLAQGRLSTPFGPKAPNFAQDDRAKYAVNFSDRTLVGTPRTRVSSSP